MIAISLYYFSLPGLQTVLENMHATFYRYAAVLLGCMKSVTNRRHWCPKVTEEVACSRMAGPITHLSTRYGDRRRTSSGSIETLVLKRGGERERSKGELIRLDNSIAAQPSQSRWNILVQCEFSIYFRLAT